jgi:hypothetical protein
MLFVGTPPPLATKAGWKSVEDEETAEPKMAIEHDLIEGDGGLPCRTFLHPLEQLEDKEEP